MSSIHTNTGAMTALQTLKGVGRELNEVKSQLATGLKVASAKDNASTWAIASTMRSDVAAFKAISGSLTSSAAMVNLAKDASEQIVGVLTKISEKVAQGREPGADTAKIDADIAELSATITSIADSAQYNGINLVRATGSDQTVTVSLQRSGSTITPETMTVASVGLSGMAAGITSASTPDEVHGLLTTAIDAAAAFGAAANRIEAQNNFLGKQIDAMKTGIGAMVDADMEEASARIQALQVQQQLGVTALSIANQSPSSILALFR